MGHLPFADHIGREHSHLHQVGSVCHLNERVAWMLSQKLRLTELSQQWLGDKGLTEHLCECNPECIFHCADTSD